MNPVQTNPPLGIPLQSTTPPAADSRDVQIRSAAEKLEVGFLTEMLRAAGAGTSRGSFGGGAGEEQFASFLLEAQATEMVQAGGIGLAQSLYEAMAAQTPDA